MRRAYPVAVTNVVFVTVWGRAQFDVDAARLLPSPSAPQWWEAGLTGRRKMHIEIGPRIHQVTSAAVAAAGEEERMFVVSLLQVAKAGVADPFASSSTRVTSTLGKLR